MMAILRRISLLIALGALVLPAAAQDLLPGSFSGWSGEPPTRVGPANFEQVAPDLAPILRECGALLLETRTYTRGGDRLTVTLYRMQDPTGAYGVFTFLRTDQIVARKLGEHSALSPERAVVMIGDVVLDASGARLAAFTDDLKSLVSQLYAKTHLGPLPTVGNYLPSKAQIANSRQYAGGPVALGRMLPLAEGDWLGFSNGAEAEMARYRVRGEEIKLLLAAYPTQQIAARKLDEMEQLFAAGAGDGKPIVIRRSVSLIAVAAGGSSREAIEELLRSVQYESQVTWNEPGYSATDPSVPEIILGVIFGTGNILTLAFFSGIAFGLLRVVVKRYLPGKVFDRPAAVEIIQLGLTSKPIQAKDFY
jgi:hypothetical protein